MLTSESWEADFPSIAGRLRIVIHGYNTEADIEHLFQSLKEALRHA